MEAAVIDVSEDRWDPYKSSRKKNAGEGVLACCTTPTSLGVLEHEAGSRGEGKGRHQKSTRRSRSDVGSRGF